jgi:hypothetical protein
MMVLGYGLEQGKGEAARPERQHGYDGSSGTMLHGKPGHPTRMQLKNAVAQRPVGEDPLTGTPVWRNTHTV